MSKKSLRNNNNNDFLELLEAQVILSSKSCPKDKELTLSAICGTDFWATFEHGDQNKLGSLMKRFVADRRVPFVFVGTNSKNHARYRLIKEEL